MKHLIFFAMLVALTSTLIPAKAYPCSPNTNTPIGEFYTPAMVTLEDGTLPSNSKFFVIDSRGNGIDEFSFLRSEGSQAETDVVPFELERDFVYGSREVQGKVFVWEPSEALVPGITVRQNNCSGCGWLTIGAPDIAPPPRPTIDSLEYSAFPDPNEECLFGHIGNLSIGVAPRKDTPESRLLALVYVGPSPEQAAQATQPLVVEVLERDRDRLTLPIHQRTSAIAPEDGFCLAIEFLDGAYNRSERSEAVCWEAPEPAPTPEESAPPMDENPDTGIDHADNNASACATTGLGAPAPLFAWLFLPGILALVRRLRQRRPEVNA